MFSYQLFFEFIWYENMGAGIFFKVQSAVQEILSTNRKGVYANTE